MPDPVARQISEGLRLRAASLARCAGAGAAAFDLIDWESIGLKLADILRTAGAEGNPQVEALMLTLWPNSDPHDWWWRSALGKAVADAGWSPHSISVPEAAQLLGVWRQGVDQLLRTGRMSRHSEGGVPKVSALLRRARLSHSPARDWMA